MKPIQTYKKGIEKGQDIIEDIRSMIEREPTSPQERNSSIR